MHEEEEEEILKLMITIKKNPMNSQEHKGG